MIVLLPLLVRKREVNTALCQQRVLPLDPVRGLASGLCQMPVARKMVRTHGECFILWVVIDRAPENDDIRVLHDGIILTNESQGLRQADRPYDRRLAFSFWPFCCPGELNHRCHGLTISLNLGLGLAIDRLVRYSKGSQRLDAVCIEDDAAITRLKSLG